MRKIKLLELKLEQLESYVESHQKLINSIIDVLSSGTKLAEKEQDIRAIKEEIKRLTLEEDPQYG